MDTEVRTLSTKNTLSNRGDRSQVGIGTLIIFIAMVLVASLAAGVLIDTAGLLQSQASDTGSETQESVTNQIKVIHATGDLLENNSELTSYSFDRSRGEVVYVYGPGNDAVQPGDDFDALNHTYVERLNLTIMKTPGADTIDLTSTTVHYTSRAESVTFTYNDTIYKDTEFMTTSVVGEDSTNLVNQSDRVKLTFDLSEIEPYAVEVTDNSGSPHELIETGLPPGESATITLVDQSGAKYTYEILVPPAMGENDVVQV